MKIKIIQTQEDLDYVHCLHQTKFGLQANVYAAYGQDGMAKWTWSFCWHYGEGINADSAEEVEYQPFDNHFTLMEATRWMKGKLKDSDCNEVVAISTPYGRMPVKDVLTIIDNFLAQYTKS